MTFRVGQKVVAIGNVIKKKFDDRANRIVTGTVLTVRDVDMRAAHYPGHEGFSTLRFEEVVNISLMTSCGMWELGYDPRCFRPVVERKTDISIFTEILNGQRVPERQCI